MSHRESDRDLDALLSGPAQSAMRDVVRALPEESLSMAWRSSLNEKLQAEAARRKRRARFNLVLRPALGLGFAGALAVFFVMRSAPMATPHASVKPSLEAELFSTHTQSSAFADVAGVGLVPSEANYVARHASTAEPDWSEIDIESL